MNPDEEQFSLNRAASKSNFLSIILSFMRRRCFTRRIETAILILSVTLAKLGAQTIPLGAALDSPELSWETDGDQVWFGQTNVSLGGQSSAQTGAVGNGQVSWLRTTLTGPGTMDFDWQLHSVLGFAIMDFYIDAYFQSWCRGYSQWEHIYRDIQPGVHTLIWSYRNYNDSDQFDAKGWIDQVRFIPGGVPPRIVVQPTNQTVTAEGCVSFFVEVGGTEPFTFQWQHNGTNIPNQIYSWLSLYGVSESNAGTYRLLVTNAYGSVPSQSASLTVIPTIPLNEALGTTGWVWSTCGNSAFGQGTAWFGQSNMLFRSHPTVQSGALGASNSWQQSWLESSVEGPGTLTFWWLLKAGGVSDALRFADSGGHAIAFDANNEEWAEVTIYMGAGQQSLNWTHTRDPVCSSNQAGAWLAEVRWIPGGTDPILTAQPQAQESLEGSHAKLTVEVDGTPPFQFLWEHNGQPILWAMSQTLTITNAVAPDQGEYRVVVWNSYGTNVSQSAALTVRPAPPGPYLAFTSVPRWGTCPPLEGMAYHVPPQDYQVAVYIRVMSGWWTKPAFDQPTRPIQSDGSWQCNICTGGIDEQATSIAGFLIPKNYPPPPSGGQFELPQELYTNAVAWQVVDRPAPVRRLHFSGLDWTVKSAFWGPGPNYFSDDSKNVWMDDLDRLHLKITYRRCRWECAEIISEKTFGYGTYRFYLDDAMDNLASNVVVGLFTWSDDPDQNHREIDIEVGRWNEGPEAPNAQFVVQPWETAGHRFRFSPPAGLTVTTHSFTWEPSQIWFLSVGGHDPENVTPSGILTNWLFHQTNQVPATGDEKVRMNLWLLGGAPAVDGKEVEVIIKRFEFVPHLRIARDPRGSGSIMLKLTGVPESPYAIATSPDLGSWLPWATLTTAFSTVATNAGTVAKQPTGFFRVKLP
jgi:hypothetical protein